VTSTISKTAFICGCGCGAVLVWDFEAWGDEPEQVYVEFALAFPDNLRNRLRAAWRVARGKEPWLHSVVLQHGELERFREFVGRKP